MSADLPEGAESADGARVRCILAAAAEWAAAKTAYLELCKRANLCACGPPPACHPVVKRLARAEVVLLKACTG